jgi:hypothetical protein
MDLAREVSAVKNRIDQATARAINGSKKFFVFMVTSFLVV